MDSHYNKKIILLFVFLGSLILIGGCMLVPYSEEVGMEISEDDFAIHKAEEEKFEEEFNLTNSIIYDGNEINLKKVTSNEIEVIIILKDIDLVVQNQLIMDLKEYDFNLAIPSFTGKWIFGNATIRTLKRITNDTRIKIVRLPFEKELSKIEPGVFEDLRMYNWTRVVVTIKDIDNNKHNLKVQSEIITNLLESEFRIEDKDLYGRSFVGNVSKGGLVKLKENPYVVSIYTPFGGGLSSK